ncbi:MAG: ABC transporter permease [Rhodospirillales bacterium]|nr:ABC transporter permease [Rhodospirillales bacterium]MDH3791118.1 ABC transporter permease [Rhodospirillales bacterium]MDH3909793.1 ABC transporter permease [Rhodospirillales bacterium]MDH3918688.1 ABC transporter permease [Rhodospirillales bacterium]MDH3969683.1 ABC transporter permease [Rhodospirillales bacterium]
MPDPTRAPGGSTATRIGAMVLRHAYLLRTSWPRIFEMMYWPTIQMVLWGFFTVFLATKSSYIAQATGILISAVLLWDVLFRGQLGFSLSFLEEIWSRNLGNLSVSPLKPAELMAALMTMSVIRTLIGVLPAAGLAIVFYEVSVFELGLPLLAFFTNLLVMGWAIGMLVCALILRVGLGAESVAWLAIFLIAPVSAIYYPVSVLPDWLQAVAWALPTAAVFEGMRAILIDGAVRGDLLLRAALLNLFYLTIAAATFLYSFQVARRRGLLLQIGE